MDERSKLIDDLTDSNLDLRQQLREEKRRSMAFAALALIGWVLLVVTCSVEVFK